MIGFGYPILGFQILEAQLINMLRQVEQGLSSFFAKFLTYLMISTIKIIIEKIVCRKSLFKLPSTHCSEWFWLHEIQFFGYIPEFITNFVHAQSWYCGHTYTNQLFGPKFQYRTNFLYTNDVRDNTRFGSSFSCLFLLSTFYFFFISSGFEIAYVFYYNFFWIY